MTRGKKLKNNTGTDKIISSVRKKKIGQLRNFVNKGEKKGEFTYKAIPDTEQGRVYKEILDNYDFKNYPFQG